MAIPANAKRNLAAGNDMATTNDDVPTLKFTQLLCVSSCAVVFPNDLTHEQNEWFWQQGVNMDDWDRMVIADANTLEEVD